MVELLEFDKDKEPQGPVTYTTAYQLYSSRNFPPLEAQLPVLKAMGYDAIEPWLPAYEADPAAFRRQLDDAGLACFGFHMPLTGPARGAAALHRHRADAGRHGMIPPYVPPEERRADARLSGAGSARISARGAEAAAPHGLKVAWHNHDFEYRPLPDGTPPDRPHLRGRRRRRLVRDRLRLDHPRRRRPRRPSCARYADRIVGDPDQGHRAARAPSRTTAGPRPATASSTGRRWCRCFAATPPTISSPSTTTPSDWQRFARRSIEAMRDLGLAARAEPPHRTARPHALLPRNLRPRHRRARPVLQTDRLIEAPNWSPDGPSSSSTATGGSSGSTSPRRPRRDRHRLRQDVQQRPRHLARRHACW